MRNVRSFENKRGPKRREKKNMFCELESLFALLFYYYSFSFALQR
jgi:hypothetical protein